MEVYRYRVVEESTKRSKLGTLFLNSYHDDLQRSFALYGLSIGNWDMRSQEYLPSSSRYTLDRLHSVNDFVEFDIIDHKLSFLVPGGLIKKYHCPLAFNSIDPSRPRRTACASCVATQLSNQDLTGIVITNFHDISR